MMTDYYFLMHKDIPCGKLIIDRDSGAILKAGDFSKTHAPFLGNADEKRIKKWWAARSVPGTRKDMEKIIRDAGCINSAEYLAKNLGLSLTDTYWIRPADMDISWKQVSLYNRVGVHDGLLPYHNATSYDPNASLGGQMEKYWDLNAHPPVLVKTGIKSMGQQSVNEVFASLLHERQQNSIPFCRYTADIQMPGEVRCFCPAFTSENTELVSAMEILESEKIRSSVSLYDAYIDICAKHGIDREEISRFVDYQTITDFLITNTDEHLMNFGVLRNTDTMQLTAPAPIFDSGNSMFYTETLEHPLSRVNILDRKITAIHDTEEKMLSHVKDRGIVKTDLLPGKDEVKELYCRFNIPESRARVIAENYETKVEMVQEFQKGKKISLYLEKQRDLKFKD